MSLFGKSLEELKVYWMIQGEILQRKFIEKIVNEESCVLFGVVDLKQDESSYQRYLKWLDQGKHAGMTYMENHKNLRQNPKDLFPGASTCLVLAYNYNLGDKLSDLKKGPRIAQYARLKDYHKFLRRKGESISAKLRSSVPNLQSRVLVDSAPLLEKSVAEKSRFGFIGKNTLFIHPKLGSYYFLFEILINLDLNYDLKEQVDPKIRSQELGGCGSCRRCSTYCPTGALDENYVLDARKCLSYYTIEHRGTIPEKYWPYLKEYLYGCDLCQLVCPYNRKASVSKTPFVALKETPDLYEIATMDQKKYENLFGGTPMVRAKRHGLQRNALIAMTVTNDKRLDQALATITLSDPHQVLVDTAAQISQYKAKVLESL